MERYTVTIITPASSGARPTLLVPSPPSAIVTAFVDELFKRIARQGLALAPNTHIATLHVDSESAWRHHRHEDVLNDVVDSAKDKIYAVFTAKRGASSQISPITTNQDLAGENTISVRIVTPGLAQGSKGISSVLQVPASTTIKQLHELVAHSSKTSATFVGKDDTMECCCSVAKDLCNDAGSTSHFLLVHGKGVVDRVELAEATEDGLKAAVRQHQGQYVESNKKLMFFGAEFHPDSPTMYKKSPVVAVCSKLRHVPVHARTVDDETTGTSPSRAHVLDLHTSEIPLHSGSFEVTLEQAGFSELEVDGVVNIYAVTRATSGGVAARPRGRDGIFRAHAHWEPPTVQGERATAMFLSSLRVFAANVETEPDNYKDAVLHVFDLLTKPSHGTESTDPAIIEQLIASILKRYEADGTAVFDTLGGAAVRRMQNPDEIVVFVVDTSASMRGATDFHEVNDQLQIPRIPQATASDLTDPAFYGKASLVSIKETLCNSDSLADMVGLVAEAPHWRRRYAAKQVIELLRTLTGAQIVQKHKDLEKRRERARASYALRHGIKQIETELDQAKLCWAGLKTHEEAVCDFLQFRAQTVLSSGSLSQRWTWSWGDDVPTGSAINHLPSLPALVTEIPDELRCPVSHVLMQDAVKTADDHTYSLEAITQWFDIRTSSPMTGLDLASTTITENREVCDAASAWIDGSPLAAAPSAKGSLNIVFVSPYGTFQRRVAAGTTLLTVYKLAFRAMAGRYTVFQLAKDNIALPAAANSTVAQRAIVDGDRLTIRVADEADLGLPTASAGTVGRTDVCLVKVYGRANRLLFSYWTKTNTAATMTSILWKYWRHCESSGSNRLANTSDLYEIWYSLFNTGDGLLTGSVSDGSENMSTFLTRRSCFGRLGEEPVHREDDAILPDTTQPLVFKVMVDKARAESDKTEDIKLSRLDVLKQMFEALINRMLAYNYKTHVVTGDIALWDALALANDQLTQYALKFPEAKKRIICISDGVDTKSISQTSHGAYWLLKESGVVLDSISLGYETNSDLRAASYLLGSYRFHPLSLENALAITEMEPFLSLTERPLIAPGPGAPRNALELLSRFRNAKYYATPTVVDEENMPARKVHPNLQDDFIELSDAAAARRGTSNTGSEVRSNLRMSRILREMQKVAQSASETASVFVSESDATFWKIIMSGPDGSPYEGGTFLLYFHADEGYPTFAPKARFVTKIKHPNVNAHGRICAPIFDRDWTSDTTMGMLINTVYGLLMQPETSDSINTTAALEYSHDQVEYSDQVRKFVRKYASKTKEEWRAELLGEEWEGEEDAEEDDVMSDEVDASSDHEMSD
ncbi:hypothetical protein LTR27_004733 [Elasticomyces elasticus]|nr:hypothetical protein LTR27_004733 [Elasticomyces elasticus]